MASSEPASLEVRNVRLRGVDGPTALFAENGRFVAAPTRPAHTVIDAGGRIALPGFVEAHLHLDKALLGTLGSDGSLADAIRMTALHKRRVTTDDIRSRAIAVVERAVMAGTTAIRAHTDVDPVIGLSGIEVMLELKRELADVVDLQLVAFPQEGVLRMPGTLELLRQALEAGAEVLGGCIYNEDSVGDAQGQLELLLELAEEFGVPLDLHADLADDASDGRAFLGEHIAQRVMESGFARQVVLAHVTSWGGVAPARRDRVIDAVRRAGIGVAVMPATDMHLGGRRDSHAVRRGIAPVSRLWQAGVPTACATNNVRNAFTPYGNADALESALFMAQTSHLSTADDLERVIDSITAVPAALIGLRDYGIAVGAKADFSVVDAEDEREALLSRAPRRWVFKAGRLVAETEVRRRLIRPSAAGQEGGAR